MKLYIKYLFEAEVSSDSILKMQKTKCNYLRNLYNKSRADVGGNDPKSIKLKSKYDSCITQLDTMNNSIKNKGETAKVSSNVGQGIGKTGNIQIVLCSC